jgi:hypothetical protein
MSHPGVGAMLAMLGGNADSVAAFALGKGQVIRALKLVHDDPEGLVFDFENGYRMVLEDQGQSCCESRYLTCDDELAYHVGATLDDMEVREAAERAERAEETDYEVKEICFLIVTTSKGKFTVASHNDHNGYYGGFALRARAL